MKKFTNYIYLVKFQKYTDENRVQRKEEYGEVFTPFHLIFDMLKKIPDYIWQDENFKWLDPVVGDGRFCLVLYFTLMKTLSFEKIFTNDKEKQQHILKKVIYMIDINPLNVKKQTLISFD